MADLSRIHKRFYLHRKAQRAREICPSSISLWLFANCWCRDHRAQGLIPAEVAEELGSAEEIAALVKSGLWQETFGAYEFHDWRDWNADCLRPTTAGSAAFLVQRNLGDHPQEVQNRIRREVDRLIDEGIPTPVIEEALQAWGNRPGAGMSWLAYMASDAMRKRETGIRAALKEARRTGVVGPLAEFGYRWEPPEAPPRIGPRRVRELMREHKLNWIAGIEDSLGAQQ